MADEKREVRLEGSGDNQKLTLHVSLTADKAEAIRRCLEKGELRIEHGGINMATSRVGDPWLYD